MSPEKKNLNILLIEDSEKDAERMLRELEKAGYAVKFRRIETEKGMRQALEEKEWDLALSDYTLPRFSGRAALELSREKASDLPFILVSGKIGEEIAVDVLEKGASGFVMKDNLFRLPSVVERCLQDKRILIEKSQAEEELRKVASRYHLLAENISDIIWTMDLNQRFTFVSPSVFRITGFRIEEILRKGLKDILTPHSYEAAAQAVKETLARIKKKQFLFSTEDTFEAGLMCKDGSTIWTETKVSLLYGPEKSVLGFLGVTRDISERKQSEQLLRESEKKLRMILEQTPDAVFTMNPDSTITFINRSVFGRSAEEIVGSKGFEYIPARAQDRLKKALERIFQAGQADEFELKDNNARWWRARLFPIKNNEKIEQALVIFRDITKMKRSERQRMDLAWAVEQLEEGVIITDARRLILFVNQAFESDSGYNSDELLRKPIDVLWKDDALLEKQKSVFHRAKSWKGRLTLRKKNGTVYESEILQSPLLDTQRKITRYIIVERDITEEMKVEKQVRQMQKMEALGTLAGGIAHDFNNLLMPIIANTELLLWETAKDKPAYQYLQQNLEAAYRGKDLVQQIITFSRKSDTKKMPVEIISVIKETLRFLRSSLPSPIKIRKNFKVHSCTVDADPVQIQQVLMNIFRNAADAVSDSFGIITISSSNIHIGPDVSTPSPHLKSGPYLNLCVSDNGCGMEKEVAERIFDPFFTTKKPGKGTGMGLAVAQKIIHDHRGDISVTTEPGKGSVFQVFLPISDSQAESEACAGKPIPSGKENILLVDDEKSVAKSMKQILERLGYSVIEKTKAREALKLFLNQPDDFDLVITDLTMPEMGGLELIQALKRIRSDIPFILTTGYSESVAPKKAEKMGIKEYIMKPIAARDLARVIRRALERKE
jgi:PAS domain S-box-containing protein